VVAIVVGFLIMLWLVLSAAGRLRPEHLRLKATVTRWLSLDLEMRSGHGQGTLHHDPARNDESTRKLDPRSGDES
jgi:hypothetical protein